MVETGDFPFPQAAFINVNYWIGLCIVFVVCVLPQAFAASLRRRFRTTFHDLAQEVEQLSWYRKQIKRAKGQIDLMPIHKELDQLDRKLWEAETRGEGESNENEHHGMAFSMDDDTSTAKAEMFRLRKKKFEKNIPGVVS
jgi:hypothetical protein|tara:strand:- start:79 stop:498 length:420 start_codon:yes stop_codon:yes gene_type:complete